MRTSNDRWIASGHAMRNSCTHYCLTPDCLARMGIQMLKSRNTEKGGFANQKSASQCSQIALHTGKSCQHPRARIHGILNRRSFWYEEVPPSGWIEVVGKWGELTAWKIERALALFIIYVIVCYCCLLCNPASSFLFSIIASRDKISLNLYRLDVCLNESSTW